MLELGATNSANKKLLLSTSITSNPAFHSKVSLKGFQDLIKPLSRSQELAAVIKPGSCERMVLEAKESQSCKERRQGRNQEMLIIPNYKF